MKNNRFFKVRTNNEQQNLNLSVYKLHSVFNKLITFYIQGIGENLYIDGRTDEVEYQEVTYKIIRFRKSEL